MNPQEKERLENLRRLGKILSRRAMTAEEIAQAMPCTKATAYARVEDLPKIGYVLLRGEIPGRSGCPAAVFFVKKIDEKRAAKMKPKNGASSSAREK